MTEALIELVHREIPGAVLERRFQFGDYGVVVAPEHWFAVARLLRDHPSAQMNLLVDLTAVHFPERELPFDVVAHLLSLPLGHRLRLTAQLRGAEDAVVDSLTPLWASANWAERECFDMFGVKFRGHPDLRRILMYPEFVGHPLRKDYPAQRVQPLVDYREAPNTGKLPPFDAHEGMPFGREAHRWVRDERWDLDEAPDENEEPSDSSTELVAAGAATAPAKEPKEASV